MIRPPPKPPLFPAAALFRSALHRLSRPRAQADERAQRREGERDQHRQHDEEEDAAGARAVVHAGDQADDHIEQDREEHTSELQSRQYLVCRLLLEKKTKTMS